MCTSAKPLSSRSATTCVLPVRNTSSGILRLIANVLSVSVCLSRPRASLNSSASSAPTSMMNARSAPEISMAASSTRASTSWSTRPDPSARNPSSSAVICRRSSRAPVVDRLETLCSSPAAGRRGRRRRRGPAGSRSPDRSSHSVTGSPLTNVPYRDSRSRSRKLAVVGEDLGVLARHLAAAELEVVGLAPPDGERNAVERRRSRSPSTSRTSSRGSGMGVNGSVYMKAGSAPAADPPDDRRNRRQPPPPNRHTGSTRPRSSPAAAARGRAP